MPDDVTLTDLEVIQQFSLAVRGATAPRDAVVQALEADLAFLRGSSGGGRTAAEKAPAKAPARSSAKAPARTPAKAPAKRAARKA
jgi:hypothetical protein